MTWMKRQETRSAQEQKLAGRTGPVWLGILAACTLLAGCGHKSALMPSKEHYLQPTHPPESTFEERTGPSAAGDDEVRSDMDEMDDKRGGELYTISVSQMPVRDFVVGLARDAKMNVDIYPGINARITLSAVNQTLPQIMSRVAKQANVRYQIRDNVIIISPDRPFMRMYQVDYVNLDRGTESSINISSQLDGGRRNRKEAMGVDSNQSETRMVNRSKNQFWDSLTRSIQSVLSQNQKRLAQEENRADGQDGNQKPGIVSINQEAGVLTIFATTSQHAQIRELLDRVLENVHRQVLIESTVVEVELNDRYQGGVDWVNLTNTPAGILNAAGRLVTDAVNYGSQWKDNSGNGAGMPFFSLPIKSSGSGGNSTVAATVRALGQFGNVKVLSSPKIMALNNQTAILKVVENKIYFSLSAQPSQGGNTTVSLTGTTQHNSPMYNTQIHTVPVGLVMSVTPQIDANDVVSMNVRPTISSISRWVNDPNPGLVRGNTLTGVESPNLIPEIRVREMESMLRVHSGQVAVMGGLMQDKMDKTTSGVPGLQDLPVLGNMFKYTDDQITKTELVIFLRPIVVSGRRGRAGAGGVNFAGGGGVVSTPIVQKITPALAPPPEEGTEKAPEVGRITPGQRPQILRSPEAAMNASRPGPYLDFSKQGGGGMGHAGGVVGGGDLLPAVPESRAPGGVQSPVELPPHPASGGTPQTQQNTAPVPQQTAMAAGGSSAVRGNFYLELGAFTDKANANELHQKVTKSGLPAFQESADVNGKNFQRVRSGPYQNLAEAEQAQVRVANETGIQAKVASY
ncbi:MAG: pilus (MSHA type) biogenesis protein MshL [Magnetococcales bacterium]|nr:pilus (MSHA type) biogenesis protein MshL [Magnetococcales bacterium]